MQLRIVILCMISLYTSWTFAQTKGQEDFPLWSINSDDATRVFSPKAYIRLQPDMNAAIIDSIIMDDSLRIIELSKNYYTQQGIYAAWANVSARKNGNQLVGYTWLGNLALGAAEDDQALYIYGIERINKTENPTDKEFPITHYTISLKAIRKDSKTVTTKTWKMIEDGSFVITDMILLGDTKLKNVRQVPRIMFSGAACATPTKYLYSAYTGYNFLDLPKKYCSGDAGAFSHVETLLFPNEVGGKSNQIIKLTLEDSYEEDEKSGENKITESIRKKEAYSWDGNKVKKIK